VPTGPKGQKRLAAVVSNAVHVMKVLTGEAVGALPMFRGTDLPRVA